MHDCRNSTLIRINTGDEMFNRKTGTALLLLVGIGTAQAANPNFKEGEWDVSYRMELIGGPFPMPPMTVRKTTCLNQKNYVPDTSQPGQDCKVRDTQVKGDTVTWSTLCQTEQGTIETQGRVTYQGDRYQGTMDATMVSKGNPGQPLRYRYNIEGKRLGACK
jgi:hypothetical protein